MYKNNARPHEASSYRPINLTCYLSKIFERLVYLHLIEYLREHNLITPHHHRFLSKKSTVTNLLSCTYDWVNLLGKKTPFDVIYIDYEKVFDKISHRKILQKLECIGIGGELLSWLMSFMTDRSQCVRVNNFYSVVEKVVSGVAQGTLLGPVLFLVYISDIANVIDPACKISLYADDSKIYGRRLIYKTL